MAVEQNIGSRDEQVKDASIEVLEVDEGSLVMKVASGRVYGIAVNYGPEGEEVVVTEIEDETVPVAPSDQEPIAHYWV